MLLGMHGFFREKWKQELHGILLIEDAKLNKKFHRWLSVVRFQMTIR